MKILLASVLFFILTGCSDDIFPEYNTPNLDHFITSDGTTITFKSTDGRNLYIRSNRSTITILSGTSVGDVYVDGSNNIITFEDPIILRTLNTVGSDNVINVPASSGITINSNSGSGNILNTF